MSKYKGPEKSLIPESVQSWLGELDEDNDKILVRRAYIDLCDGDLHAAFIFSQLMYYFLPGKTGESKVRVHKGNYWWVAKRYEDWEEECRVRSATAKKKIKLLKSIGLVITCSAMFDGLKILHLRIDFERLETLMRTLGNDENSTSKRANGSDGAVGPAVPDRSDLLYPIGQARPGESYTESTAKNTIREKENPKPFASKGLPDSFPGDKNIPSELPVKGAAPDSRDNHDGLVAADAAPPSSTPTEKPGAPADGPEIQNSEPTAAKNAQGAASLPHLRSPEFPGQGSYQGWDEDKYKDEFPENLGFTADETKEFRVRYKQYIKNDN